MIQQLNWARQMPKFKNLVWRRRSVKIRVAVCQLTCGGTGAGFEATTGSRVSSCHFKITVWDAFSFVAFLWKVQEWSSEDGYGYENWTVVVGQTMPRPLESIWKASIWRKKYLDCGTGGIPRLRDTLSGLLGKIPHLKIFTEEEIHGNLHATMTHR